MGTPYSGNASNITIGSAFAITEPVDADPQAAATYWNLFQGSLGIRDQAAVGEMLRFIDKDGREEADAGAHDDRVLTHAIAAAVLARSRNASPPKPSAPAKPYRPRVSSRTGY